MAKPTCAHMSPVQKVKYSCDRFNHMSFTSDSKSLDLTLWPSFKVKVIYTHFNEKVLLQITHWSRFHCSAVKNVHGCTESLKIQGLDLTLRRWPKAKVTILYIFGNVFSDALRTGDNGVSLVLGSPRHFSGLRSFPINNPSTFWPVYNWKKLESAKYNEK